MVKVVGWFLTLVGIAIMVFGLMMYQVSPLLCIIEIVAGMLFTRSGVRFRRAANNQKED